MNGKLLTDTLAPAAEAAGRVLLAGLFLYEGFVKLRGYDLAVQYMAAYGVPGALLPLAIATELGCGALILIGWQTKLAALALSGFCLLAAAIFHTKFSDTNQVLHFAKDVALAGAFLFVAGRGAGRFSLDAVLAGRREPAPRRPV
ncbi:MAG: DoxX family protein [Xanthobacteraceae bacterium]|nr:DoxX family protein [Xanthobacteraceae bacterium]